MRMKYNLLSVKEACECLYILDVNPCSISYFLELFCRKYDLTPREHSVKLRGMLRVLDKKGFVEIKGDYLHFHNTLTTGLKMEIIG
jgi:hypothetical protein